MKNILLLGIGGTGARVVGLVHQELLSRGALADSAITAFVFDTDEQDAKEHSFGKFFNLAADVSVDQACEIVGKENVSDWFPVDEEGRCHLARELTQFNLRRDAFLALNLFLLKHENRILLDRAVEEWVAKDPQGPFEVYVIASLAGACGSGCLIPLTLYLKKFLKLFEISPNCYAALFTPDVHTVATNSLEVLDQMRANAYATLRELNAIQTVAMHREGFENVRFRLGMPHSPTGVLFDAANAMFHTPVSVPFRHVYLMGRQTALHSIRENEKCLAKFLSYLCDPEVAEDISYAFDSAYASQNTYGRVSDALYSAVALASMQYPADTFLHYAVRESTRDAVQNEWLALHRAVEEETRKEQERAKLNRKIYACTAAHYAKKYLAAAGDMAKDDSPLYSVLQGTLCDLTEQNGKPIHKDRFPAYMQKIQELLYSATLPDSRRELEHQVRRRREEIRRPSLIFGRTAKKRLQSELPRTLYDLLNGMTGYYAACDEAGDSLLYADQIFPRSLLCEEKEFSLFQNLLCRNGEFIPPQAAMLQLCRLREELADALAQLPPATWAEGQRTLPSALLTVDPLADATVGEKRSLYAAQRETNFPSCLLLIAEEPFQYRAQKTDAYVDTVLCLEDVSASIRSIQSSALQRLERSVYSEVLTRVDTLIDGYRDLFQGIADVKELSSPAAETNANCEGDTVYLGTDSESKAQMLQAMEKETATFEGRALGDAVAGETSFRAAYDSILARYDKERDFFKDPAKSKQDAQALLGAFAEARAQSLRKTDFFTALCRKSIFETLANGGPPLGLTTAFRRAFSRLSALAKPSAKLFLRGRSAPPTGTVAVVPKEGAKFLGVNAQALGLQVYAAPFTDAILDRFVSEFFSKCELPCVSVSVSDRICANRIDMIACTTMLRAEDLLDFNETAPDSTTGCYPAYCRVIAHMESGKNVRDPHLGNRLYEEGRLPYLNKEAAFLPDAPPEEDAPPQ